MLYYPKVFVQSVLLVVMGLTLGMVNDQAAAAEVVFTIVGNDDQPVADAVITLDDVTNDLGDYAFAPATQGIKAFSIVREGYDPVGGQFCTVDYQGTSVQVDVIMQREDDLDLTDVVWYNQNMLCKFINGTLHLSLDYGKTYSRSIDLSAIASNWTDLKTLWIFEDNKLFFADHNKCYYSHDWETYHESTVYDVDGEVFVPLALDNFSRMFYHRTRPIIGDRELYVWGNYSTRDSAYTNIHIWMTSDKGVTVRSTYRFRPNRSDTGNGAMFARHMHKVEFCPLDNTLWAQTGDHSVNGVHEQHWLLGRYDHLTDTLTWEHLKSGEFAASGNRFKSLNMVWRHGYLYWSCDTGGYLGGAYRVPYVPGPGNLEQILNPAEHEHLVATENDGSGCFVNDAGDMLVFQTTWGGSGYPRLFQYSPDNGKTWHAIDGPVINHTGSLEDYMFTGRYGGFIYGTDRMLVRPVSRSDDPPPANDYIDIARFVRNIGFFNAFRPVADAAPSNLFLAGGVIQAPVPAGTVVGVLSADGIPTPEFQLVGEHDLVKLDARTKRQLMLKRAIEATDDGHDLIEQITVKAVNRAGESTTVIFPLNIHFDLTQADTIGYWRFEDSPSPGFTADSRGNGFTLTEVSTPTQVSAGGFDNPIPQNGLANLSAASFDGSSDCFTSAYDALFAVDDFTIEAYIRRDAAADNKRKLIAVQYEGGNDYGDQRVWALAVAGDGGVGEVAGDAGHSNELALFASPDGTSAGDVWSYSGITISPDVDYFVAATFDLSDTGAGLTFYVKDLSNDTWSTTTVGHGNNTLKNSTTAPFKIGSYGTTRLWDGLIDEVRWSDAVLPFSQLLAVPTTATMIIIR